MATSEMTARSISKCRKMVTSAAWSRSSFRILPASALALLVVSFAQAQPNLTPYKTSGWSDKIVVATAPGATDTSAVDAAVLRPTDTLYLNWAVDNDGSESATARFFVAVFVDGVLWNGNAYFYADPPLAAHDHAFWTDKRFGSLSVGIHSIQILADSTGAVAQSNESDHTYTRTIEIVGEAGARDGRRIRPALQPTLAIPIGGHLGGDRGPLVLQVNPGPDPCPLKAPCVWNDVEGVTGGTAPYHYAVGTFADGAPPFGMTVDVISGSVHGTPTVAGTYLFEVCVIDLVGASVCQPTTITVGNFDGSYSGTFDDTIVCPPPGTSGTSSHPFAFSVSNNHIDVTTPGISGTGTISTSGSAAFDVSGSGITCPFTGQFVVNDVGAIRANGTYSCNIGGGCTENGKWNAARQ
jgi:hypothetical protein